MALGERFEARGIPLRADARSPFRIYRDVRFSKDKSPYKTHVSASFPREDNAPSAPRGRMESVLRVAPPSKALQTDAQIAGHTGQRVARRGGQAHGLGLELRGIRGVVSRHR